MKHIAIGIIAFGVIIGGLLFIPSVSDVVTKTIEIEKTIEVPPEWAKEEDPDGIKAYQDVIRHKELTAKNLELDLQIAELKAEQAEIEKELGF